MTSAEIQTVLEQVITTAGIAQIISVDDEYREDVQLEDVLGLNALLPQERVGNVFAELPELAAIEDIDARGGALRAQWETIANPARTKLRELLIEALPTHDAHNEESIDLAAIRVLRQFLSPHGLRTFSLSKWNAEKDHILATGLPITLLLIDENFSREGGSSTEGLRLIKEVFGRVPEERALCALVSHNYSAADIHQQWQQLCIDENLDRSRFVLIPKIFLTEDLVGFARLLKLAILNSACNRLTKRASELLMQAQQKAADRLRTIDIYEFDQIVFRSSEFEGVWAPDTLFRLFGLFQRDETRSIAKHDEQLRHLADAIRKVSQIPTDSPTAPVYEAWQVQRLELYEDGEYINGLHMPIEIGDIFQRTGNSTKRYILLAQPCDLMVRGDGKRHYTVNEGFLAEVNASEDKSSGAELKFFDPQGQTRYFVDFRRTTVVKLCVLDLTAYTADGAATLTFDSACPGAVIPTWAERYKVLQQAFQRKVRSYSELVKKGTPHNDAVSLVFSASNIRIFGCKFDATTNAVSYDFKRIARLRQPRAAALLMQYANFMARQAFDHDFQRPEGTS